MRTALRGLLATTAATCIAGTAFGQTFTQWIFNSAVPDASTATGTDTPNIGTGTITVFGTTGATVYVAGSPNDPQAAGGDNSSKSITGFPTQGTGSGTAGMRFDTATTGKSNVTVSYDQRNSGSASSWWRFEYTTDGTNFITTGLPTAGAGAGEYQFPAANSGNWAPTYTWNLSSIAAVNNNANFGFRIVSIFDPVDGANYTATSNGTVASYTTGGTNRYDVVTVLEGVAQGSCCRPSVLTCSTESQATCLATSGALWTLNGSCTPNPCSGACCTGASCASPASIADCNNPATQSFFVGATCSPTTCPIEVNAIVGDIAYAANIGSLADSVQQIRGAGIAPSRVGTWGNHTFIEFNQFDNSGGNHNADGNLIAMNFGATPTSGGIIYNFSTDGSGTSETIYTFDALNPIPVNSRVGAFAISPDNALIVTGTFDTGQIVVLEYAAGGTPGTGAGASIGDGVATDTGSLGNGQPIFQIALGITTGTAWLDNDTMIVFVESSDPFGFFPPGTLAIFTMDYDASTNTLSNLTARLAPTDTGVPDGSRFLGLAYNPTISPYLYTMSSGFTTLLGSHSRVNVIDVSTWTEIKSIVLDNPTGPAPNGSLQTGRSLTVGPDRQLYVTQFAGSTAIATDALIDTIDLDNDNDNDVDAADTAALADNSSVDFYLKGTATTASFNSADIAMTASAPATGICCYGATCRNDLTLAQCTGTLLDPGAVERAGTFFLAGSVCNQVTAPKEFKVPCCKSDYNKSGTKTVQDLFDYLADYFPKRKGADTNGNPPAAGATVTVADLFDYLAAYFQAPACGQGPSVP